MGGIKKLKQLCRERGLKDEGNRMQLRARLRAWNDPEAAAEKVLAVLADQVQVPLGDLKAQANILYDEPAVLHLFNIAASLASLVIGEPQVLGHGALQMACGGALLGAAERTAPLAQLTS